MSKAAPGMKLNTITLIISILLGFLCQPTSQGLYHPPSPNFLLECTKGRSAQGCWSAYGTYCDKNGFIRNPKPNSRTECVGQTKGWCHCSRVADDIIENPYYKWPPQDTDLPGPFGPGGVSGTSSSGTPYGYMAWESFKLEKGSNSTNATYAGPAPLLVLHDSAGRVNSALRYDLVAMALGVALSGLATSWGTLLVLGPVLLPRVAAGSDPTPSPKFLLECSRGKSAQGCFSQYGTYCDGLGHVRRPNPNSVYECSGGPRGWCRCSRVVEDIFQNPYYNPDNTNLPGSFGPGGVGGTSSSGTPYGYMAWESLKDKANDVNGTNSTNATYTVPAPLLVLHESAASTQTALQSAGFTVGLMTFILGAIICSLVVQYWWK